MSWFLFIEIIAAACGLTCVFLQTKEKVIAWPFGIVSVALYVYVFYESFLYSDVLLHAVYIGLNIYGWYHWVNKRSNQDEKAAIGELSKSGWIIWPTVILFGVLGLGYFMGTHLGAQLSYFDAFTTSGSLVAQYLLARKIIQNWLWWIVVDVVASGVYIYKDLYVTAILFFAYLILCIKGYKDWQKAKSKLSLEMA